MELPVNIITSNSLTAGATPNKHFFQNAAGFDVVGGQFVLGDVHNHCTATGPQPSTSLPLNTLDETFSESEIYCSQMLRQKRGFPLYEPAPQINFPAAYQRHGVSIGDVGTVTPEGIFDFFFNIFLPREHAINANDTPEDFSPMSPYDSKDVVHLHYDPGKHVSTSTVRRLNRDAPYDGFPGGDFVFNCDGPQGAILALPYGADLQKLRNVENMRTYATKHAASWYKYINGPRGRGLANGELYLVTGSEKAQSWGMASYYANHEEFGLAFKPTVKADTIYPAYRWSGIPGQKNPSQTKSYDRPRASDEPLNHTTFIHGLSISLGTGLWSRLFGTVTVGTSSIADFQFRLNTAGGSYVAGSQGWPFLWSWNFLGGGGATGGKHHAGQNREVVLSDVSPNSKVYNPAKLINEYILHKAPHESVIMTHDDDWCDILGDDSEILTLSDFLQQFTIAEKDGAIFPVLKSAHSASSTADNVPVLVAPEISGTFVQGTDSDDGESSTNIGDYTDALETLTKDIPQRDLHLTEVAEEKHGHADSNRRNP
ncbi:hypothetical protein FB451DRAFT_1574988, partial [Mycena latifolia]